MCHPYLLIVLIMAVGGLAGGGLNYALLKKDDPEKSAWRSFLGGLVASFAVPVFLNMISSNLIDSIRGNSTIPADPAKLFILLGFCLVAAVSSKAFISTISDRILNETKATRKEVKQIKSEVEPIVAKETEAEPGESKGKLAMFFTSTTRKNATDEEKAVLNALVRGNFTFRSITGLSTDVPLDRKRLSQVLKSMEREGWVRKVEITKDEKRNSMTATSLGRTQTHFFIFSASKISPHRARPVSGKFTNGHLAMIRGFSCP